MNTQLLVKDNSKTVSDFNEALELSQSEFGKKIISLDPTTLRLNADLTVDIPPNLASTHGVPSQLQISKSGIISLCKSTYPKIPYDPFAAHISTDLFRENIHELMPRAESLRIAVRNNEPVIVGFMTDDMAGLSDYGVLNAVVRGIHEKSDEPLKIIFTDQEMTCQSVESVSIAPVVGDISKIGQVLFTSAVANHIAYGRLFTLRLVCMNGAVMPKSIGSIRSPFGFGDDEEHGLATMKRKIDSLSLSKVKIATRYQAMTDTRCNEALWSRIWSSVNRIVEDPDEADNILQIEKEARQRVRKYVKDAKEDMFDFKEEKLVKNTVYEVFNLITFGANTYTEDPRKALKLQALSGKFLDYILKMPSLAA